MGFGSCRTTVLNTILIGITGIRVRRESAFHLSIDRFFNYLLKAIELMAALFYSYYHQRFQPFSEIPNHCTLF